MLRKTVFFVFFADDSNLFLSRKDREMLIAEMNIEIKGVTELLTIYKLSLIIDKIHFMLFKTRNKSIELKGDLIIYGVKISRVEKTKFLGVYIDSSLLWRDHIHYIEGKVARSIGAIIKARKVFNQDTLRTLYYTFLCPYFNYCIEVWGNTYSTYMDPLIKLQNRALRIITGSSRRVHLAPLYRKLKLLDLPNIYMYAVQLFMYKRHHDKFHVYFGAYFVWIMKFPSVSLAILSYYACLMVKRVHDEELLCLVVLVSIIISVIW